MAPSAAKETPPIAKEVPPAANPATPTNPPAVIVAHRPPVFRLPVAGCRDRGGRGTRLDRQSPGHRRYDITYLQLQDVLASIYGADVDLRAVLADPAKWPAFLETAGKLAPPAVNSMPIFDETIQPDREQEIRNFRFMGRRFSLDAAILQQLVYRDVKENSKGQRRMLPKGLDVPAALGSTEAYAILQSMGETDYGLYPENMARMQEYIAGLDQKVWTQDLYWNWLYTLLPLTQACADMGAYSLGNSEVRYRRRGRSCTKP